MRPRFVYFLIIKMSASEILLFRRIVDVTWLKELRLDAVQLLRVDLEQMLLYFDFMKPIIQSVVDFILCIGATLLLLHDFLNLVDELYLLRYLPLIFSTGYLARMLRRIVHLLALGIDIYHPLHIRLTQYPTFFLLWQAEWIRLN